MGRPMDLVCLAAPGDLRTENEGGWSLSMAVIIIGRA